MARYEPPPMAPLIDNTALPKPIMLKCDEPGSITVQISGYPKPTVRWQIGRRRVKESSKYQMKTDGKTGYTLVISRVTDELESGVWVVANSDNGEDCCLLEVKTYNLLVGQRSLNNESDHLAGFRERKPASCRIPRVPSFQNDTQSVVSLDTWKREMVIRNQMRSVDDLIMHDSTTTSMDDQGYAYHLNTSFDPQSTNRKKLRSNSTSRVTGRGRVRHFSSTEAISCEIPTTTIPPVTMDMQSISSVPGTPYQQRRLPSSQNFVGSTSVEPIKTTSTIETEFSEKGPPRRKRLKKRTNSKSSISSLCSVSTIDREIAETRMTSFGIVRIPSRSDINTVPAPVQQSPKESQEPKYPAAEVQPKPADVSPPAVIVSSKNDLWELLGIKLDELCKQLLGGVVDLETRIPRETKQEQDTLHAKAENLFIVDLEPNNGRAIDLPANFVEMPVKKKTKAKKISAIDGVTAGDKSANQILEEHDLSETSKNGSKTKKKITKKQKIPPHFDETKTLKETTTTENPEIIADKNNIDESLVYKNKKVIINKNSVKSDQLREINGNPQNMLEVLRFAQPLEENNLHRNEPGESEKEKSKQTKKSLDNKKKTKVEIVYSEPEAKSVENIKVELVDTKVVHAETSGLQTQTADLKSKLPVYVLPEMIFYRDQNSSRNKTMTHQVNKNHTASMEDNQQCIPKYISTKAFPVATETKPTLAREPNAPAEADISSKNKVNVDFKPFPTMDKSKSEVADVLDSSSEEDSHESIELETLPTIDKPKAVVEMVECSSDAHSARRAESETSPAIRIPGVEMVYSSSDADSTTGAEYEMLPLTDTPNVVEMVDSSSDADSVGSIEYETLPATDIETLPATDIETLTSTNIETLPATDIETLPATDRPNVIETDKPNVVEIAELNRDADNVMSVEHETLPTLETSNVIEMLDSINDADSVSRATNETPVVTKMTDTGSEAESVRREEFETLIDTDKSFAVEMVDSSETNKAKVVEFEQLPVVEKSVVETVVFSSEGNSSESEIKSKDDGLKFIDSDEDDLEWPSPPPSLATNAILQPIDTTDSKQIPADNKVRFGNESNLMQHDLSYSDTKKNTKDTVLETKPISKSVSLNAGLQKSIAIPITDYGIAKERVEPHKSGNIVAKATPYKDAILQRAGEFCDAKSEKTDFDKDLKKSLTKKVEFDLINTRNSRADPTTTKKLTVNRQENSSAPVISECLPLVSELDLLANTKEVDKENSSSGTECLQENIPKFVSKVELVLEKSTSDNLYKNEAKNEAKPANPSTVVDETKTIVSDNNVKGNKKINVEAAPRLDSLDMCTQTEEMEIFDEPEDETFHDNVISNLKTVETSTEPESQTIFLKTTKPVTSHSKLFQINQEPKDETDSRDAIETVTVPSSLENVNANLLASCECFPLDLTIDKYKPLMTEDEQEENHADEIGKTNTMDDEGDVSRVTLHEYGELIQFRRDHSLQEVELDIESTKVRKQEIEMQLAMLWDSSNRIRLPENISDRLSDFPMYLTSRDFRYQPSSVFSSPYLSLTTPNTYFPRRFASYDVPLRLANRNTNVSARSFPSFSSCYKTSDYG